MNKILLIGRLGRDADEMRYTPAGVAVLNFSLAVDDGWGENKITIWYRCTLWGKLAESVGKYLKKGKQVFVEGRMAPDDNGSPRIWTNKAGEPQASFEVNVSALKLLGSKDSSAVEEFAAETGASTEEVPF